MNCLFQLLEVKITDFIRSGSDITSRDGVTDIERDLTAIQNRWKEIKEQVKRARQKIELTIQLYTLVQEVIMVIVFRFSLFSAIIKCFKLYFLINILNHGVDTHVFTYYAIPSTITVAQKKPFFPFLME